MNPYELQCLNIGKNLDDLMNLDPRGYGLCRILYSAAAKNNSTPLSMTGAKKLYENIEKDDIVFIITGFILPPHGRPETDGLISSVFLARALVMAFEAKPLIICPSECIDGIKKLSAVVGLHCYIDIDELKTYPKAVGISVFTKDEHKAEKMANGLIKAARPKAAISIECPGANKKGVYHNAGGLDVTSLQAKSDMFFQKVVDLNILNIAIGDLGNEVGMASFEDDLKRFVPYMKEGKKGSCLCGCEGGIMARTRADNLITATVSDWGCYALIASLAFLCDDIDILQSKKMLEMALYKASESGIVDMDGWLSPQIDGMSLELNLTVLDLMRLTVNNALEKKGSFDNWYKDILELGYFN